LALESKHVSKYRVWKDEKTYSSRISKTKKDKQGVLKFESASDFKSDWNKLEEELGFFYMNERLKEIFEETEFLREKLLESVKNNERYDKILFVEDKYDQIYKITWLKLKGIEFNLNNVNQQFANSCSFHIQGLEGASAVAGFLRSVNIDIYEEKKIIGLFDFDYEGTQQFKNLKKGNEWDGVIYGTKEEGYYQKRSKHDCFISMLLPVPNHLVDLADLAHDNYANYIEVENLLPVKFLLDNHFVKEKKIVGSKYYQMKADKKDRLWKKLIGQDKELFSNFGILFDAVEEFFKD